MGISTNIKNIRKKAGLSQMELAEKSGLSIATIQGYEQGKYNPKMNALTRLCVALDCKITDLIDEDNKKYYRMFDHLKGYEQRLQEEAAKKAPEFTAYDEKGNEIKDRPVKFTGHSRSLAQKDAYDLFHSLLSEEWIQNQEQETVAIQLKEILDSYNKLNDIGKKTAVERIRELCSIPKYVFDNFPDVPPQE